MGTFIAGNWWALALFGLFVGVFAGLFGLGGGAVLVPLMVLALGFTQRAAQGTSLAIILSPTAAPAILKYHREANIDWWFVLKVAPFMLAGSYFGATIAHWIPQALMKVLFSFVLIYIAGYIIFSGAGRAPGPAAALAMVPVLLTVLLAVFTGALGMAVRGQSASTGDPAATAATAAADAPTQFD